MKFILILYMLHSWGGGGSSATFANLDACENAGVAFENMIDTRTRTAEQQLAYRPWLRQWICVPYGNESVTQVTEE